MLDRFDTQSRWHLRAFAGQVMLLAVIGAPVLLVDRHAPALYLFQLRAMFSLSALVLLVIGMLSRQALPRASLCIWDRALAFVLLKAGCSLALRMLT